MDIKQFEKEMISRANWEHYIRVIFYKQVQPEYQIAVMGEFDPKEITIAKGKKIAAYVRNWFLKNYNNSPKVVFEKVPIGRWDGR